MRGSDERLVGHRQLYRTGVAQTSIHFHEERRDTFERRTPTEQDHVRFRMLQAFRRHAPKLDGPRQHCWSLFGSPSWLN
jgi:hypothetical protein